MTLGAPAKKHGEPGKASCSSTTPLSASAFCTTRLPASVAGPVPAARGMGMKPLASPCSAAIAGGVDKLRERPILSFMQCAVDPLGHDGPNLEANLVAAEHGLASGFMPMPLAAGTGPATLAGNLVVQNAEALSRVVLLQLAYPGSPCFFAGAPSVIDLRTGGYTGGSPEDYLLAAASTQLAHFYGMPMAMGTMATGAKEPDWQAAIDDSLST